MGRKILFRCVKGAVGPIQTQIPIATRVKRSIVNALKESGKTEAPGHLLEGFRAYFVHTLEDRLRSASGCAGSYLHAVPFLKVRQCKGGWTRLALQDFSEVFGKLHLRNSGHNVRVDDDAALFE